jgi:hypothetical protein
MPRKLSGASANAAQMGDTTLAENGFEICELLHEVSLFFPAECYNEFVQQELFGASE